MRKSIITALAGTAILGGLAMSAAPAFADTNPSASANANVHVALSITIGFTTPSSFSLAPGVTSPHAIAFNIATNDPSGYTLSLSASDDPRTSGGASFPAASLTYNTFDNGGGQVDQGAQSLRTTPQVAFSKSAMSGNNGDDYYQNWTANLPANTTPGDYSAALTYIATAR